jgi:hypothetical protein
MIQQVEHQGPIFERWRERMAASVGAQLGNREPDVETEAA